MRDDDHIRTNLISAFIEDFVASESKQRLHYLLSKPHRRPEIPKLFYTLAHLEARYMEKIEVPPHNPESLYALLRGWGAGEECFVLSMEDAYKDQVSLKEALHSIVLRDQGNILYCQDARVGYYEGHGDYRWTGTHGNRYILRRR